ncbi:UNVERIFIED_ORG: hypothetical protein DFO49_5057 [Herbaspirillum seropedicae]
MTRHVAEAEFIELFADLINRFDESIAPEARPDFAGAAPGDPHEHTTRIHFLDELVELLGWSLGLGGDMAEETRLKAETTTFIDYLGVAADNNTPALLIEAKAWDKPFVTPRRGGGAYREVTLLGEGINHWRAGGSEATSPVAGQWHKYIAQVGGYVKGLKDLHGHVLPRAVIASGQWIVVFIDPVQAFVDGPVVEDVKIKIFEKQNFKAQASELFALISKRALTAETPFGVLPAQVNQYVVRESVAACFHAVHVSYQTTGTPFFGLRPRVLVYPALVLLGTDDMLLVVLQEADDSPLEYSVDQLTSLESLNPHLLKLEEGAADLLAQTAANLGMELRPAPIGAFPGFRREKLHGAAVSRPLVRSNPRGRDNWIIVTGQATHFVFGEPDIGCRFHKWSVCNTDHRASGTSAVSRPLMTKPRALFVDEKPHHCAHSDVMLRKQPRCQIHMIDSNLCCRSCTLSSDCWPGSTQPPLPCGA